MIHPIRQNKVVKLVNFIIFSALTRRRRSSFLSPSLGMVEVMFVRHFSRFLLIVIQYFYNLLKGDIENWSDSDNCEFWQRLEYLFDLGMNKVWE